MFTDERHIICWLIDRCNEKGKHSAFNFIFTENRFYWSTSTNFFIYWWHNMSFPFWKMVLLDPLSFDILSMNWSTSACISSRASSKQICFSSRYFRPLDMSWGSLSLSTIFQFPVVLWPYLLFIKKWSYLLQQYLIKLGSLGNSSKLKWSTDFL